jgi:hypothetical protein
MSWEPISCVDRDLTFKDVMEYDGFGVISGRSDMSGEFGDPRVETIWGIDDTQHLKDVRHPRYEWDSQIGDRRPCEHYEWVAES